MKKSDKTFFRLHFLLRQLLISILCSVCVLSCTACQNQKQPSSEVYSTNVIHSGGAFNLQAYGPYIYAGGKSIRRYHRGSNLLTPACMDPECDGSCPLHGGILIANQLVDGRLYFYSYQNYTHIVRLGYQDIVSGDVKVLVTLSDKEDANYMATYVWDGYMYYSSMLLRDGGDQDNPNDYVHHICRVSVNGGDGEAFLETSEAMMMVADGVLVTMQDGTVYGYDILTKERKTLFNIEELGYRNLASEFYYVNGKVYFQCRSTAYCTSEYRGSQHLYQFLLSADIHTGEVNRVVENPTIAFTVTDDAIYYAPFELRHMYIPDDYEQHLENVVIYLASATLHACDLDGRNHRAIYTNETMDYTEGFTVIDGSLYGWIYDFDPETFILGSPYFARIDFESGKVTPAREEQ